MKVSLHRRRRHESLPPRPAARSPWILVAGAILTTGTMAFAASRLGDDEPAPAFDPAVNAAEQATRDVVDARLRAHLRELQRG